MKSNLNKPPYRQFKRNERPVKANSITSTSKMPETEIEVKPESGEIKPVTNYKKNEDAPKFKLKRLKLFKTILLVGLAFVLGLVVSWAVLNSNQSGIVIDSTKYQAVSMTDGQVYFGKLSVVNDDYMQITDIYYLKAQNNSKAEASETTDTGFNLVKLTEVVYNPEDKMVFPKNQMQFFENLDPNGKVAKLINQDKAAN